MLPWQPKIPRRFGQKSPQFCILSSFLYEISEISEIPEIIRFISRR